MNYRQDSDASPKMKTNVDDSLSIVDGAWAYESGKVIEKGSIILSRAPDNEGVSDPESGLAQQYFHKSIILVLEHDDNIFTKGIILNRPSNLVLSDEDFVNFDGSPLDGSSQDNQWKTWFGGEVSGILSDNPEIICVHFLDSEEADEESEIIMKGIKWTTLEGARSLVQKGIAEAHDFLTFIGYCGWDAGQLREELDQESWYMVAADSRTVLEELQKNDASEGILDAGLESWSLLMRMIGRQDEIDDTAEDDFNDLMLKEWTKERLLFPTDGEGDEVISEFLSKASGSNSFGSEIGVGSVLRSTASAHYNPFLLSDQEYHKCILLVVQEDDEMSVGVLLNLPTATTIQFDFANERTGAGNAYKLPERYGGRFSDASDEEVLLWFHCNESLKDKGIGEPLGMDLSSVWNVSPDDAANAIVAGQARAEDFLVVSGISVWEKAPGGIAGGIRGEVNNNLFEVVPTEEIGSVFDSLLQQEPMTREALEENIAFISLAWSEAQSVEYEDHDNAPPTKVYKSNTTMSDLADTALKRWISAFLLES